MASCIDYLEICLKYRKEQLQVCKSSCVFPMNLDSGYIFPLENQFGWHELHPTSRIGPSQTS